MAGLVATVPNELKPGVYAPGERRKTYDFRYPVGSLQNSASIECWYEVTPIQTMLERVYETDAHFVPYIVYDQSGNPLARQPRINKSSVPWILSLGYEIKQHFLIGDWDNQDHQPWNDLWYEESFDLWRTNPWLRDLGGYYGLRGQRVFQQLVEPIPVLGAERVIFLWINEGREAGINLDCNCATWPHHYRCPNVLRGNVRLRSNASYFDMKPRDVSSWVRIPRFDTATLAAFGEAGRATIARYAERYGWDDAVTVQAPARTNRRIHVPGNWSRELPAAWGPRCDQIAQACAHVPLGSRHEFYRHLAGGLCHLRVPLQYIPTVIESIAARAGHNGPHHNKTARDTVYRHADGLAVTGIRTIQNKYPEVAELLAEIGIKPRAPRVVEQQEAAKAKAVPPTRLQVVQGELLLEMLFGPLGITIIQIECGGGKTYIAQQAAAERASQCKRTETGRIPSSGRTIISSDTHQLVLQTARGINERHQLPIYRGYGPASLHEEDGTPVCRYHESAKVLAGAHISVNQALCLGNGRNKCEYFDGCRAREGWEGEEDAAIVLTVHAKMAAATGHHGKKALLIIDEPPSAIENEVLNERDLEITLKTLGAFERRYANALEPLVHVARAWVQQAPLNLVDYNLLQLCEMVGNQVPFQALKAASAATQWGLIGESSTDILECAVRALSEKTSSNVLPIQVYELVQARKYPARAKTLATASKVLYVLYQAARGITAATKPLLRAEIGREHNAVRFVYPNHQYRTVLQTQHRTLLLDANGSLQVPMIKALTGLEPALKKFSIEDNAPIERCILPYATATRASWQPYGVPLWNNGITRALARAIEHAKQPFEPGSGHSTMITKHLGIISYMPVIVAIGACLYPNDRSWQARWTDLGLHPSLLTLAVEQNRPVLASWDGTMTLGYYGAVKGLNSMAHCDMTITLGDPRPSVDMVQLEAKFLGLPTEDYVLLSAQATLEQSHGRLRATQRTNPGRMLHIGQVLSSGFGWDRVKILDLAQGDETKIGAMSLDEFLLIVNTLSITVEQISLYLGVHRNTITSYIQGRNIPRGIANALRQHYAYVMQSQQK